MLLALAVRLWIVATQTYIVHPDETFQYLEAAHRLAFGSGIITWEYLDGIRSWLLPGAIAGIMRAVDAIDPNPQAYILVLRLLCAGASLAVPYAGYRLGGGVAAGLLSALSPQALYFAPVIMTEPLATYAILLAIVLGHDAAGRPRRLLLAGVLFGLACSLRYQYAPVIAAVALWQHVRRWRECAWVAGGGVAVVAVALGGLDAATWGAPFQSVWLNFLRNGPQGISAAMGQQSWSYYLEYFAVGWGVAAPVFLVALFFGARRAPTLAILIALTFGLHSLVPHKELRFIFLGMAAIPILIGLGLMSIMDRIPSRWSGLPYRVGVALCAVCFIAWGTAARTMPADEWHRDRSLLLATAAARDIDAACGLAIRDAAVVRSCGYSYWHRDLPIYYETWDAASTIQGSSLRLRIESVLDGRKVPQYAGANLSAHADKFNVAIGALTSGLPSFSVRVCFGEGRVDDRTFCVFTRPGGCD